MINISQEESTIKSTTDLIGSSHLEVFGACVHNLRNIDVAIPRNQLVVITGISGSGKSSLAFDTIYAEGQRRYMESFSAYARQFMGEMERPEVEKITGLSPVISIEQKTTNKNPRSTVGTVTEVYDFMRLLFARASDAISYASGKAMVRYNLDQIIELILTKYSGEKVLLLAPLVRGRKGHYRELFEQIRKQGYLKARIDGEIQELVPKIQLDRYKVHDIEVVIDRLIPDKADLKRLKKSVETALKMGKDALVVQHYEKEESNHLSKKLMDPDTGISYDEPSPNSFSFNSPYGACPSCNGLGREHRVNLDAVVPDWERAIRDGAFAPLGDKRDNLLFKQVTSICKRYGVQQSRPVKDLPEKALNEILYGHPDGMNGRSQKIIGDRWYSLDYGGLTALLENCFSSTSSDGLRRWAEGFMNSVACSECSGMRLKKSSLWFKLNGKNISELAALDLDTLNRWFEDLPAHLNERQKLIAGDILKEIRLRLGFILDVGLSYLSLDRPSRSLSGGEAQRIRLATQIGSKLSGITYILDEPTIGLHQHDNEQLIEALKSLRDSGNTVIVVEHDKDLMLAADYVIDLGPGAGEHGGLVVGHGSPEEFIQLDTLTAAYLKGEKEVPTPGKRRSGNGKYIRIQGATGNNLKDLNIAIPLATLTCVTGVSGSGKSSLINETLYPYLRKHFYNSHKQPLPFKSVEGVKHLDKVIEIDQSPIGRTPRSNPVTYINVFGEIRKLFSDLPESKVRGYKPGRFSFNVKGGRCTTCEGAGMRTIEMNFLPDVYVHCEDCRGKRYNRETLEIHFKGKSISDVLEMTVEEGVRFFKAIPRIYHKLKTLEEVGLGYIRLGQQSTTLSGGEAQRVKLSSELSKKDTGSTFYILDEPTTGLHFEDIRVLMEVINRLVDKGNTVVIIEHNLDVIKQADFIIDLGPEGGKKGGRIVATGSPEVLAKSKESYTGRYLNSELRT